jgi:hypothetical protein
MQGWANGPSWFFFHRLPDFRGDQVLFLPDLPAASQSSVDSNEIAGDAALSTGQIILFVQERLLRDQDRGEILDSFPILQNRYGERLPGGWGVMVDDVLAGVCANLALRLGLLFVPVLRFH